LIEDSERGLFKSLAPTLRDGLARAIGKEPMIAFAQFEHGPSRILTQPSVSRNVAIFGHDEIDIEVFAGPPFIPPINIYVRRNSFEKPHRREPRML
jgi:hypothetical protein